MNLRRLIALLLLAALPAAAAELSFNRDIRPILSDNCYSCHGPDKPARKGDRRLDTAEGATAENDGVRAIVAGDLAKSDLVVRIESHDPDEVMPPPKSEKKLTPAQIALLKKWIEQGAKYEPHWSLIAPQRPAVPQKAGARNPIDGFILARLEAEKLAPSPEADRTMLIRRVTYDLTGLPPTPNEIDTFLADTAPESYERLVDQLLASPRYGEKMAVHWLDLSRYADTHGYHLDAGREMWKWREWVISAFNRNQRFDEFALWQLAGDLLPNATVEQRLATGFSRNSMINFEGGAIAEEYLAAYIKDRTNTFATAFLGLTLACCECHDHKFDPFTQREYYQLFSYFNAVPERGLDGREGNAAPVLALPSQAQTSALTALRAKIAAAEKSLAELTQRVRAGQAAWEQKLVAEGATEPLAALLAKPADQRTKQEVEELVRRYNEKTAADLREPTNALAKLREELKAEEAKVPTVMVMEQMAEPRETHLLVRGQYNQPGDLVQPGTPASLPPLPKDAPPNRLGLARWLVDPQHPLMSRVAVNRFWKNFMGTGLVKTLNDFGSQGEWPSHPELLDWLATEFTGSGWDVKHLVRLIVTSGTYRQSAKITPELKERDPYNRLYAHGPRFRLSAEEIRDTALAVSGLLSPKIGGPSVSPYQPEGLWEELSSRGDSKKWTAQFYEQSHGEDLYRRSMYTFWKRTCPPPQLQTFDAPDRETCTVNRERTNTPLQALVLLNDPTYVEASRTLAERMMTQGGATPAERVRFAFRLAAARTPSEKEVALLVELFDKQKARYTPQREEALKLLANGEHPRNEALDPIELAAWTNVASTILNLDETVTKG
jgi:mono/diheme cytochrome c family protein